MSRKQKIRAVGVSASLVNRQTLAKSLGIALSHLDALRRNGIISSANPGVRPPLFDLEAATNHSRDYRAAVKKKLAGSESLNASVLRRWKSRVRIAEQRLSDLAEKTSPMADVQGDWDIIRGAITKRLREFSRLYADSLVNLRDSAEIAERLDIAVRETLFLIMEDLGGKRPAPEDMIWARVQTPSKQCEFGP